MDLSATAPKETTPAAVIDTPSTTAEAMPAKVLSTSKEHILDAAQNILAEQGYTGLSMRELATESGLAKATIYHHFHDKSEIFRQVLERDMTTVHTQLIEAAAGATGAVAKIKAVIHTYYQLMRERRTIIMNVMRELGNQESNLCEFINDHHDCYFAPIRAILEEGIAEGTFRPLNVEHAGISMVGMINAFMLFRVFIAQEEAEETVVEQTIELFFHGILLHPNN